jgi:hypothetical protein
LLRTLIPVFPTPNNAPRVTSGNDRRGIPTLCPQWSFCLARALYTVFKRSELRLLPYLEASDGLLIPMDGRCSVKFIVQLINAQVEENNAGGSLSRI